MDPKSIFINTAGRLRSGWRVLLFAPVFLLVLMFLTFLARGILVLAHIAIPAFASHPYIDNVVYRLVILAAALAAGTICAHGLEDLPFRSLGLTFHRRWLRDLLIGSLVGIASLAIAAGIGALAGGLTFTVSSRGMMWAVTRTLLSSAVLFVFAALAEEALFRGYPLQTLTRARLAWLGVLLTSLPFAAAHLNNPNSVLLGSINTGLAGVWLAAAYLKTRSLWFPLGVHWAWNWALGSLFGLPVSGIVFTRNTVLHGVDHGPAWLTGGAYGIEGGIAATAALIVSTLFIWRTRLVAPTEELWKLTSEENAAGAGGVRE